MTSAPLTAVLTAAVTIVACASGPSGPSNEPARVQVSAAARNTPPSSSAPSSTRPGALPATDPGFPHGSVLLAGGKRFDYAGQRDETVYAAAGADVFSSSKSSGIADILATFPGEATRGLIVTAQHVVVPLFPLDPSDASGRAVKGDGRLVAIPKSGGPPVEVLTPIPITTVAASAGDALFVSPNRPEVLRFGGPHLDASGRWAAMNSNAIVYGLVAFGEGAAWMERDAASTPPTPVVVTMPSGRAPRALASLLSDGITARDDRTVYAWKLGPSNDSPLASPRFARKAEIVALDAATGAMRVLARDIDNPISLLAAGSGELCATVSGADFESTAVLAVPEAGGPVRAVAALPHGLHTTRCVGADATSFSVLLGFPGAIAILPTR
jgi:hypothetical protein